jgi:hypothetical protein
MGINKRCLSDRGNKRGQQVTSKREKLSFQKESYRSILRKIMAEMKTAKPAGNFNVAPLMAAHSPPGPRLPFFRVPFHG